MRQNAIAVPREQRHQLELFRREANLLVCAPVGTFTIGDPQNWVALLAFLAVSLVASNLSAVARLRISAEMLTRSS
jgi:K+-sensing histidine kinase KdpD